MRKKEPKVPVKVEAEPAMSPFGEFERRLDALFRRPFGLMGALAGPDVDIFEEGGDVVVKAEVPGMKKEEIAVEIRDDRLTISGEKKKEEKVEKKDYYRFERSYGAFTRSFTLPPGVRTDGAKATFRDGVLEIRIPKAEEAQAKVRKVVVE